MEARATLGSFASSERNWIGCREFTAGSLATEESHSQTPQKKATVIPVRLFEQNRLIEKWFGLPTGYICFAQRHIKLPSLKTPSSNCVEARTSSYWTCVSECFPVWRTSISLISGTISLILSISTISPEFMLCLTFKSKSKLSHDRRSVGQNLLV